jgi:hypothetical protein
MPAKPQVAGQCVGLHPAGLTAAALTLATRKPCATFYGAGGPAVVTFAGKALFVNADEQEISEVRFFMKSLPGDVQRIATRV